MARHRSSGPPPGAGPDRGRGPERGAVTAELAVGLPVVVLLLVAVLTLTAASTAQMRALDAARAGARAYAIGEDDATVRQAVARVGGQDAELTVDRDESWVRVTVTRPVVGGWFASAPVRATGEATAWVEP
ncbi:hypothetical protein GCM10009809_12750 [Isoptericola hypogeus]|uniref:TadE-like domain-containing protein n=1 Tax=Isoptericola hypogeus TaxID=300179 RepID=A0ABN2J5B7_9MICO